MPYFPSLRAIALPPALLLAFFFHAPRTRENTALLRAGRFHWTADTPIKVGGGSMTFHSKSKWQHEGTVTSSDCASIAQAPSYTIILHDKTETPTTVSGAWTVTFSNFHLKKPGTPGREGVTMTVNPNAGCKNEAGMEAVTITTFHNNPLQAGHVNFYADSGLPADGYISSRRYHNDARHKEYNCAADRDSCERLAFVSINKAAPIACTTPDCAVLVQIPD